MTLEKASMIMIIGLGLAGTTIGLAAAGNAMSSSGEVDYCYIEMTSPADMSPQFKLMGHRPWRNDMKMGVYPTLDEAKQKADVVGCKMGMTGVDH